MAIKLYVCGTRGSFPTFGKDYEVYGQATTCYVIREDDYAILLDCGTGIVNAVDVLKGCSRVDVLLSHVHYDHIMGLFVISNPCPEAELTFYGNFNAWNAVSNKGKNGCHTFWPEVIKKNRQVSVKPGQTYSLSSGFTAQFEPSSHGDGAMMTKICHNSSTICFTGDYEVLNNETAEECMKGTDWLIFDGTYSPEEYPSHKGWGHSTWKQACDIARECDVKHLFITHYSGTNDDISLKSEENRAKQYFARVSFVHEGFSYILDNTGENLQPEPFLENNDSEYNEPIPTPEPVKIRAKAREEELKQIAHVGWLRKRSILAAIGNWIVLLLSFLSVYKMVHQMTEEFTAYCPFVFLCIIMLFSALLSIINMKSVNLKDGSVRNRSRIANMILLFETSAAAVLLISSIILFVLQQGFGTLTDGTWPGGILTAFVIPIIVILEFFLLETRSGMKMPDLCVVLGVMIVIFGLFGLLLPALGLTGAFFEGFSVFTENIVYLIAFIVAAVLLFFLNRLNVKSERGYMSPSNKKTSGKIKKRSPFLAERNRQFLYLVINLIILISSLIHVVQTINYYGLGVASHPAMISIIMIPVCIISIVFNIRAIRINSSGVYPVWYKYISYTRTAGVLINMITAATVLFLTDMEYTLMIIDHWGGGIFVYLICPLLSLVVFFMETQEYSLKAIICTVVTFLIVYFVSVVEVSLYTGDKMKEFDVTNFYTPGMIVTTAVFETCLIIILYIADRIYVNNVRFRTSEVHVERDPDGVARLLVGGARINVAPTKKVFYAFGQASNCYCVRDGSYGMILDCGSGLVNIPEFLKGCTDVDVFLSDIRFPTIMGLLAVPNPCPGAKIRFFGPFGRGRNFENMNGFAMPPLWPVCIIVGECISITPDKDIRLNDRYTVRFIKAADENEHYVIRIGGALGICYTGLLDRPVSEGDKWADNCDILIADGHRNPEEAVMMAETNDVTHVLVANHDSFADDISLCQVEKREKELCQNLSYARQGMIYTIN